ncbi:GFA family protein [Sphingomonas piscis]|uniref:GFA family protein n=1 Tax=Sphingomonas piscis TaxID=2714943 RepID=A0A6G7YQ90_9SPHN|nr:GFA family protein [Sphingomonas piscis]QIK78897.1 GFA family protein [Sphingomonas piscis]
MSVRASCSCGQLRATANGTPVRVSACHCNACKKRTGSAFSAQARWIEADVTTEGRSTVFTRIAESGNPADFHFCSDCGATVFFSTRNLPGTVAIPLGVLDDPFALRPNISIFEEVKQSWVTILGDDVEHID